VFRIISRRAALDPFGGFADSLSLLWHIRSLTDAGPGEG
jgi:hypothetical protein